MVSREVSFDATMDRILNNISDKYDKRETSIIYQATAMIVPELLLLWTEIDLLEDESFPDTCNYINLVRFAKERNIYPRPATYGIVEGEFNTGVSIGARFNCDERNYKVYEKLDDVGDKKRYLLLAEEIGHIETIGNLTPIEDIEGLEVAKIVKVVEDGKEEETLESLRNRYMSSLNYQAFGGNRQDYMDKVMSIDNIGTCKVFRREPAISSEIGKVEVVILDNTFKDASEELIKTVKDVLDPQDNSAGYGVAPIGHFVRVTGATKEIINIHTHLTLEEDVDITEDLKKVIEEYFNSLRIEFGETNEITVRISQIENRFLDVSGVLDVANTTLNGHDSNITVSERSIPILGEVTYDKQ